MRCHEPVFRFASVVIGYESTYLTSVWLTITSPKEFFSKDFAYRTKDFA